MPAQQARRLVVVRHAKAEAHAATDAGRPLSEVGLKQARETGAWLGNELGETTPADTTSLVSTAVRTRQTWDEIARHVPATVRVLNGLYAAATAELLSTVQMAEPDVRTVVLVGHNPSVHELVAQLAGASAAGSSMPPSTAVVLDVSCAWHDLQTGCADVRSRHTRTA